MRKILLVEDDPAVRRVFVRTLERRGAHVITADGLSEAGATLERECPDVVLTGLSLRDGDGLAVLQRARALRPNALRFLMSGGQPDLAEHHASGLVGRFFPKPLDAAAWDVVLAYLE